VALANRGGDAERLLCAEENEPNYRHRHDGDADAHHEKQQDRRPGLGLSSFRRRFDNDAVLFDGHNRPLDLRCEVSAVEHRHCLDILGSGAGRSIFRCMAQCFVGGIQAIHRFVRSAAGIVTPRRKLRPCINADIRIRFVHVFILCGKPNRPHWDGSCWMKRSFGLGFDLGFNHDDMGSSPRPVLREKA